MSDDYLNPPVSGSPESPPDVVPEEPAKPSILSKIGDKLNALIEDWAGFFIQVLILGLILIGVIATVPSAMVLSSYAVGAVQSFPVAPPEVFVGAVIMLTFAIALVILWILVLLIVTWFFYSIEMLTSTDE